MKKDITLDELASMVAAGFADAKEDVAGLRAEMEEGFSDARASLTRIENRMNTVEDRTLANHERRIARLEDAVLQ